MGVTQSLWESLKPKRSAKAKGLTTRLSRICNSARNNAEFAIPQNNKVKSIEGNIK